MTRPSRTALLTLLVAAIAALPTTAEESEAAERQWRDLNAAELCAEVAERALCEELIGMKNDDQNARYALRNAPDDPRAQRRLEEVDARNQRRLREILESAGWPLPARVGEQGSAAAWTVLQHAPADMQERYLPMVKAAYEAGGVAPALYATFFDRILVRRGEPQLYGTQFHRDESGRLVPHPIADEEGLAHRREEMRLQPFEEYRRTLLEFYAAADENSVQ